MNGSQRWRRNVWVFLAAGLCLTGVTEARSQVLFMGAKGELVQLGAGGTTASTDRAKTWHPWSAIKLPDATLGFHSVVRRGNELLAFAYMPGDGGYSGTKVWWSSNEGQTWSGGNRLTSDTGRWAPESQRVVVTSSGRVIVPITQIISGDEGSGANNIGTIYSDDGGRSWTRGPLFGPPKSLPDRPEGFSEPAVVELANGKDWMVFRSRYGTLWQALSTDDGASWSAPSPTKLVSPLSAVNAKRIPDTDAVIAFWNNAKPTMSADWNAEFNHWKPRKPLVYAISKDNCQTWSEPVVVDPNWSVYAQIVFSGNDMFVGYHGSSSFRVVAYDIPTVLDIREQKQK